MTILTVTQLNTYVKSLLDGDRNLSGVYVRGEISNFTNHYRTGHYYLTLKDKDAAVRAVMFRAENARLRFLPEDGMSVLVRGRVSLFPRDGQYQLYIDDMQPDGVGALHVAFEQLKQRLGAEGLFDDSRKKALPPYPMRVGVITSETGAAVRDIVQILGRRFPLAAVVLCPVKVQGDGAAQQICKAIRLMNEREAADVLIVGRGGGSIEDLWAFNEEITVRAVAASAIPVVSAVGHETDFTICDFAADLRAPTPSAAAELVVPDCLEERGILLGYANRTRRAAEAMIREERLRVRKAAGTLRDPRQMIEQKRLLLDRLSARLDHAAQTRVQRERHRFALQCGKLDALSPLRVLQRGYTITEQNGAALDSVHKVQPESPLVVRFSDGLANCTVRDTEVLS